MFVWHKLMWQTVEIVQIIQILEYPIPTAARLSQKNPDVVVSETKRTTEVPLVPNKLFLSAFQISAKSGFFGSGSSRVASAVDIIDQLSTTFKICLCTMYI